MGRVLLVTLGTGPGVEGAVAFSVREASPELVTHLGTDQSEPTLARVAAIPVSAHPPHEMFTVGDPMTWRAVDRDVAQ